MTNTNSGQHLQTSITDVKSACARLIAGNMRGTAYLVAPDLLITCEHVVRNVGLGGTVQATFYQSDIMLQCTVEDWNTKEDWAALRLPAAIRDRLPLRCTESTISDTDWLAFGFPESTGRNGIVLSGVIRDLHAIDAKGNVAIQLHCTEAAAAQGAFLQGGSGSPVMSQGRVIGHMRTIIPDELGRAEMGVVFACPTGAFVSVIPPSENYRPLNISALSEEQYHDLVYDILIAEGFQDLIWQTESSTKLKHLVAHTVITNPAGGIEHYRWYCTTELGQTEIHWSSIESIVNSAGISESSYLLLIVKSILTNECKNQIEKFNRETRQGLRIEIWDQNETEKRIYRHPKILRKHFPSWWSTDYEADLYLENVHRILRQLINSTQPIWDNYADKRPFTDLMQFVAKQGRPSCDVFDLAGTLSRRQRRVLHVSLKVADSLQQYLLRSLNLPQDTFLIPAAWKDHPNERILIHMQGVKILHADVHRNMTRLLSEIAEKHYEHLKKNGVIAASTSWKPWGPDRHVTCYLFSYEENAGEDG